MIVLLDNYDSFTYNLHDYIRRTGVECVVLRNDKTTVAQLQAMDFDALVISPGPGRPADAGITLQAIEAFYQTKPILGICLGFQAIGEFFGATLVHGPEPVHGKTSMVQHIGGALFAGVPATFEVMRYHSLVIQQIPDVLQVTAATSSGIAMALQHRQYPVYGLQFHPESVLTPQGYTILHNWVQMITQTSPASNTASVVAF